MRFQVPILATVLLACGEPAAPGPADPAPLLPTVDETQLKVQVVASAAYYRPLDFAAARITNLSPVTVYLNPCAGQIEGFGYVPGEWNGSYGSGHACPLQQGGGAISGGGFWPIHPGASVEDTLPINNQAYAGLWRFQFEIRDSEGDILPLEQRISEPFHVVR